MRKAVTKKVVTMGMAAILLAGSLAAGTDVSAAKKLSVSTKKITLEVGKKKTIKTNMSAKFSVSNKKVVSLKKVKKKQCSVVAKKKGSCTITVKANKQVKKIKVTVSKKAAQTSTPTQGPTSTITPIPETENLTMEGTVNYFGFNMMNQLDEGKNIVISPYSIMTAMTLLDNAADGETKEEIEKTLGIKDLDQWNKDFSEHYKNYMNQPENENTCILRTANSIWKNEQFFSFDAEIQKNYLKNMSELYGAEEKSMDFVNGNPSDQINSWVDEKTEGMIKQLFESPLDQDIQSVLVNAVYFNGNWQEPFAKGWVWKEDFNGKNGTTKVDMMHEDEKSYRYLKSDKLAVAEFPFKGDNMVMDVVLAEDGASTIEEFGKLSNKEKVALFQEVGNADYTELDVSLPKFKLTYGTEEISDDLEKMGIKAVFSKTDAQLPALRGDNINNIYVKNVVHKAVIEVDEGGARAAAATGVIDEETCAIPVEKTKFKVNKPFVCVLRDKKTNMIYFMGQIEDLTEENVMD